MKLFKTSYFFFKYIFQNPKHPSIIVPRNFSQIWKILPNNFSYQYIGWQGYETNSNNFTGLYILKWKFKETKYLYLLELKKLKGKYSWILNFSMFRRSNKICQHCFRYYIVPWWPSRSRPSPKALCTYLHQTDPTIA